MRSQFILILAFFYFFGVFVLEAQNVPSYVSTTNLVGWWPFTGNAKDSSGNGDNGTVSGASLDSNRFGIPNSAYRFNGSTNSISFASKFVFHNNTDATISIWIKPATIPNSLNQATYLKSSLSTSQDYNRYNFFLRTSQGILLDYRTSSSNQGTNLHNLNNKNPFPKNFWHHVVYVRKGNVYSLYINGRLINTVTDNSPSLPTSTGWELGEDPTGNIDFAGKLDDVGLWSRALTSCEVYQLYTGSTQLAHSLTTIKNCGADSINLSGLSYLSYLWSNSKTTKSIYVKQTGIASLVGTDSFGCKAYDTFSVTILPKPPVVKLGNDTAYCGNFSRTLNAQNGGSTYLWNTSSTSQTINVTSTGWYGVKVTHSNGCFGTDSIFINRHPLPVVNLGKDTLICGSFTRVLDAKNPGSKFFWKGGDSTSQKTVNTKGIYSVKVVDIYSCTNYDTIEIKNPVIKAKFKLSDTSLCFNTHNFLVKDTSKYTDDAWKKSTFYFGDGSNKVDTSAQKIYTDTGKYMIKLVLQSRENCKDSIIRTVRVLPSAKIGFAINKSNQCFNGHSYIFTNTTTLSKGSFTNSWLFGDDSTSTQKDINGKTYLKDSSYTVRLIVTTDKNCKDTVSKPVIVYPNTKVIFTASKITQCFNHNTTSFTNTSTIRTGTVASYGWNFGDNTSSSQKNITDKTYSTADSFKVSLLAISDKGCRDSLKKTVFIWANTIPGFTINKASQCFNGHNYDFTNTSAISQGSFTNDWLFGDGSSTLKDINDKTYLKDSSYSIRLITTSDRNCRDTIIKPVTVFPNSTVLFTPSKMVQCFNYHHVDFINASTVRTGSIATWQWNLGDNSSSSSKDVLKKKYSTSDSFKISLLTLTDKGCRDSLEKTIHIWPNTLIGFNVNKDTQCYEWNRFDFTNTSTLQKGIMAYDWQLGDASSDTARNINAKKYALFGSYQVRLITTTDKNCRDTVQKKVMIHASPVAKFAIDKDRQCYRGNVFSFTNQSGINNGSITTYDWNLDNGQQKSSQHVANYSFITEDSFDVRLIALSDKGCYDTVTHLAVTYAQPVAKYTIPNDSQCWQKHYFTIINQTTLKYGTLNNNWDFGDGTSDNSFTPVTKKYANKSAKYTIRYKVSSDHGCSDSLNHIINLLERPISEFDINDSVQCFRGHLFSFTNKTTFSAMNTLTYYWDYGNGNTSTGITPQTATYPSAKYYPVQLSSYSYLTNCYDTVIYNVLPAPHSVPGFTVDNDSQCLRFNQFSFTNLSTLSFGSMTYNWNFRDATASTQKDPAKHYASGNNYVVKLVVSTNQNCKDSIEKPITLIPHPKARFSVNDTSQCLNKQGFDLVNNTTLSYGTFSSNWLFDDATTNAGKDVNSKQFTKEYYHKITLTVNSQYGCTDTTSGWVYLEKPKSTVIQLADKDSQCLKGNKFGLSAISTEPGVIHATYQWSFGDGNSGISNPAIHKYSKDGKMKISLETTSANGCRDTGYYDVVVHAQPVSSFTATEPCFPDPVIFKNTSGISSGNIISTYWDLGDGSTSTQLEPVKYYSIPGRYDVRLISRSFYGCSDTLKVNNGVRVKDKPVANFSFKRLGDKAFDVSSIQFNNLSSSDVTSNYWNFGNGSTSTEKDPVGDFKDTSRKLVTLIVTNADLCMDTFALTTGALITDFVFYLPDAFTPNGNGHNDVFKPVATVYVSYYVMEIFNRWGEKVFETHDITQGWDGTYQGEICEQGVYICRVYVVPQRGHLQHHELTVTLLR